MGRPATPDARADALASRQYGAINRLQALGCGLSETQIKQRVRSGRWRVAVRGTYVMSGSPETWQRRTAVAWVSGPAGTVASHLSAAALLGLAKPPAVPHVTVPRHANGRFKGAVVHHAHFENIDLCVAANIPCTRAARTVVDCAGVLAYEPLCEILDDLLCRAPHTPLEVREAMERASRGPGRRGLQNLGRALEVWTPGPRPGSRAEMRLVRQLQAWGFPLPERQMEIRDSESRFVARVDLGYRDSNGNPTVVLEYQGERHHGPRAKEHDARRLRRIEATGVTVVLVDRDNLRSAGLRERLTRCVGRRPSPGARASGAWAA